MASAPNITFGRDLPVPPDAQPYALVFEASALNGNQLPALGNAQLQQNAPSALAIWAITGDSSQAGGFAAQIYVTRNGQQVQLGEVAFSSSNLVGTASRPFELASPMIIDPGDLVTVELSNYAQAAADVQVVLWAAASEEGI